jgi:hypothetical protein
MATQLGLYNAALLELGETVLAALSENVEARRVLDALYPNVLASALEAGSWNFAMRTIRADADPDVTPQFGYAHVFGKPSDWVRSVAVSADENFAMPLLAYVDDVNYWSADTTPIYVRYVSNDMLFGLALLNWPASFTRYVELELAARACERLTQNSSKGEWLQRQRDHARRVALSRDAMNEAQPKFRPPGRLTLARHGGGGRDRGSRSQLIG